jgi:hypothetical protein
VANRIRNPGSMLCIFSCPGFAGGEAVSSYAMLAIRFDAHGTLPICRLAGCAARRIRQK